MMLKSDPVTVTLACHAMATRFEFVLCGNDKVSLRAAGEEAIREINRIEKKLSYYEPTSIISQLNARAGREAVRVDHETFAFLKEAAAYSGESRGAFDPTVGPLMKAWGLIRNSGIKPDKTTIRAAQELTGMHHIRLDEGNRTVRFGKSGMQFDPGGIGKGYALDQAALLLKELGIEHALIHGGTSTVVAWGTPAHEPEWKVAVKHPGQTEGEGAGISDIFPVNNCALSVSAVWGKAIEADGKKLGHVIDPRTGTPVESALLAACTSGNATAADAYSTAMLVLNREAAEFAKTTESIYDYYVLFADGHAVSSKP